MKKYLLLYFLINTLLCDAQQVNKNFERWQIGDKPTYITGMSLSPDGKHVALACSKNMPLLIYDYKTKSIVQEIKDVTPGVGRLDRSGGYNVYYSAKGNYLLVQQKRLESSFKKSREADYKVVDLAQGKVIHKFSQINDAKISFDETQIITLEGGTVHFRDIKSGKSLKSFKPEEACNALAISPDGKELAVVIKPSKKEVMMVSSVRANKKAIKAAAKLKHMVAIYSAETFMLEKVVQEIYDNINLLFYTDDGKKLLSFNAGINSYVNVALPQQDYEPTRESYLSKTTAQPEFGYSHGGQYFAVATYEVFPSLNIYNVESGSMVDMYNTKMRIWKNAKEGVYTGTNTAFVFLPGDKYILMGYGNSLIKWKFNK